MIKGKYYITVSKQTGNGREIVADTREGYLFDKYGIEFGICKEDSIWTVTELKTGLSVVTAGTRKKAAEMITEDLAKQIYQKLSEQWRITEKYSRIIKEAKAA